MLGYNGSSDNAAFTKMVAIGNWNHVSFQETENLAEETQ